MRKRVAAVVCALTALSAAPARAQTPSVEEQLLALINGPRSHTIVMHAGLRAAARAHSAAMASAGQLSHKGAHGRIYNAAADPAEPGGGSDDGFTGTWCEVVSWEDVKADENVPRRFYDDWIKSTEDSSCMSNGAVTAAGVGAYERAGRWWVTLEVVQDKTPPVEGAVPAAPTAVVASGTPLATRAGAMPSSESHESSSSNVAAPHAARAKSSGITWQEVAVAAGAFSVVPLLGAFRRRRTPRQ